MHIEKKSQVEKKRRARRVAAEAAALAVVAALAAAGVAQAAPEDPVHVTVNGADVAKAAQNRNGLTFKGFGVLSANSTSSLLMDYKAEHADDYWKLVETLFGGDHPIMNTVKIELGNDRNTSTGPNVATMRTRDEYPNVEREPGFQLAADAQKVATGKVHISVLRWREPAWVKNADDDYVWYKNTVLAAYREYGVMVDTINPDVNETSNPDEALLKQFTARLKADTKGYEGATADDPNNGFATEAEAALFHSIRTIGGETASTLPADFGDQMLAPNDPSLRDAVDIVGFHYSSSDDSHGNLKKIADVLDKEVWNSEGQATFSSTADRPNNNQSDEAGGNGTGIGGVNSPLEMANWVTTGFAASRRTMNIFQPAIGSFYDGFQYSSKELVSARDPWSGWIYYDGGLAVLEHFTQFATLGWENPTGDPDANGIWRAVPQASASALGTGNPPSGARAGNASYTTLAAPDASDFSTVIVNDSKFTKTYTITAQDLALGADKTMEVWETRAADAGEAYDANYVVPVSELQPGADGTYTVTVKPWSTVTATTLDHAQVVDGKLTARPGYGNTLPTSREYTDNNGGRDVLDTDASGRTNGVTTDSTLYADDFDYAQEPPITTVNPNNGKPVATTESYLDSRGAKPKPDGTPNVQAEDNGATPRYTNDTNGAFESVATADAAHGRVLRQQIGANQVGTAWNNGDPKTTIGDFRWANYKVAVDVRFEDGTGRYATVGAREQGGTANGQNVSAAELRIDPDGNWSFMRFGTVVARGTTADVPATAFQTGSNVWNNLAVQVAGNVYTGYVNGVQVVSYTDASPQATGRIQLGSAFTNTQFDNLVVSTVPGYTPYYTTVIDGMHQTSWKDTSKPVLQFNDQWSHVNGQGMFEWQRTASNSTGAGAAMSYTFKGTGLDILGTNSGAAKLNVTVDGVQVEARAATMNAGSERTTFELRGLRDGMHTVTIATADAGSINVDAVGVVVANADSAAVDTSALAAAVGTVSSLNAADYNPATWAPLAALRTDAAFAVAHPVQYGLDAEGAAALAARLTAAAAALVPHDVSADVRDLGLIAVPTGGTLPASLTIDGTSTAVTWAPDAAAAVAATAQLGTVTVAGQTSVKLPSGVYQRFTTSVLVTPANVQYFIDSGSTSSAPGSVFGAVSAAFPGLLNTATDQTWDGVTPGTTWGYSTTATTLAAGTPADWTSSYVGADYNKPITYHLTLPAGTSTITTIQAPRPGMTTNVYETIRSTSGTTRQTAVSPGTATAVTQTVTLATPQVVDVEFGTNGTSGYNARLALVVVQSAD